MVVRMSTNIFIDTSTYLSFYAVSNDDLEQLEKLVDLISDSRVKIFVTMQVEREWARNRDNKLAEAIGNLEKISLKAPSIPRFMWEYAEVAELRKALSAAERARTQAIAKAKSEAGTATTNADRLIQRIFAAAGVEPDDDKVFSAAQRRMLIGDPPGKPNSLGDRINWEHLLASKLTGGDLHIISKDGDYFSLLDPKMPKYSLYREWIDLKNGKLFVHLEIKQFLSSKFPQFRFKSENQPEKKTDALHRYDRNERLEVASPIAALKEAALKNLENSSNSEELEGAVKAIQRLLPHMGEGTLLRICKFAINTDLIKDYDGYEEIIPFFVRVIPKVSHLLDRKEIEALEMIFDIEIHPEEFHTEDDPFIPDYGQIDLDLLDQRVDDLQGLVTGAEDDVA